MSLGELIQIKTGLQDFFRTYSAVIIPTTKSIERVSYPKLHWKYQADFDIIISAKRLVRDNIDAQLGNVEREIMRICCQYHNGDIEGIEDLIYGGHQRIYGIDSNWSKANWATRISIRVKFHAYT